MKIISLKNLLSRRGLLNAAALSVTACWLLLTAATVSAPFHNWLHGGVTPQDDDCAVVQLATGKVNLASAVALVIAVSLITLPVVEFFSAPFVFQFPLPPGRGPPPISLLSLR